ncbi:transposase, partial [Lactobacillus delbrueckii subsp. lactis]|uniref:transposase n=1 Tax=Lactobacillus delbrueckii TaxID=1584 RepID=UPI001E3734D3
ALQEMAKLAPKRDLEILTSIPGIGKNTALRIISELGDIRRFNTPSQLNAFVVVDIFDKIFYFGVLILLSDSFKVVVISLTIEIKSFKQLF